MTTPHKEGKMRTYVNEDPPYWFKMHPKGSWEDLRRKAMVMEFAVSTGRERIHRNDGRSEGPYFNSLQSRMAELIEAIEGLQSLPPPKSSSSSNEA